ncbi:MAG: cytidylate kinase family protein [Desulfobacterales bacterium]
MAVITVSRQFGCGGKNLGKKVADTQDMCLPVGNYLPDCGSSQCFRNLGGTVEKRGRGKISLDHFPDRFPKGLVDKVSKIGRYIDESIYLDYLVVLIAQFAEEGDVVIMGRGSQYILQDHPDAIHVLLVNSLENRVRTLWTAMT